MTYSPWGEPGAGPLPGLGNPQRLPGGRDISGSPCVPHQAEAFLASSKACPQRAPFSNSHKGIVWASSSPERWGQGGCWGVGVPVGEGQAETLSPLPAGWPSKIPCGPHGTTISSLQSHLSWLRSLPQGGRDTRPSLTHPWLTKWG